MNNSALLGFSVLGIAVLVHVIIVNITIGSGWISAMARFLAWWRNAPELEIMSRRVFKILIVHELFSGVWGTVITVILAGFFPTLMAIATNMIFYPILIAISAIFLRIPSIALFWYTWGKIRPGLHSLLGFVMALSGFGVPLGFRYIFAQLTYPNALDLAAQGFGNLARIMVFFNPVYLPLIMHTWFGAMSIGGFIVASFFAIRGNVNARFAWIGFWHGIVFLVAQAFTGPWYLATLSTRAPILFDNVVGSVKATWNVLPLFASKLLVITLLALTSLKAWARLKRGFGEVPRYLLALGPVSVLVALMGEFLNDAGRYPYMVLAGAGGIGPEEFVNVYLELPLCMVYATILVLLAFIALFMTTAYYALNRRFLTDLPEEPREPA